MKSKAASGIMLTLLFIGILSFTFDIQPVKAAPPTIYIIYIRADGSIDPATANITSSDNVTYTFTADINASLRVEKNNIVVDGAGYTVQRPYISGVGIFLDHRNNVTIKNIEVTNFEYGIFLTDSSNNTVTGNTFSSNSGLGIFLDYSNNNTITGNTASSNNRRGIYLQFSSNNTVAGNTFSSNSWDGIFLYHSSNNTFFHNNLVSNPSQAIVTPGYVNTWDDGVEGNYWSNYAGNDTNRDGIGDAEHVIDADNIDYYPLMGMFHTFDGVNVISNSTVESFDYFEGNSTIRLVVSNMTAPQTLGFCRVCIPKSLMSPPYTVVIDNGATPVLNFNASIHDNSTHRWIYFNYPHSKHMIFIVPGPSIMLSILSMLAALMAVIVYRRKHRKKA